MIIKVVKRNDMPATLVDQWEARWTGQMLQVLVNLPAADRLHNIAQTVDDFLQEPTNLLQRVSHAATQTGDRDLRTAGELAMDLQDVLTAFGRDVAVPTISQFTAKVKYVTLTDLDVATGKAIIEVTTRGSASRKVSQLAVLKGPEANPLGLPVFHYMPNLDPASSSATALTKAGSAGVYNDRAALVAAIRSL